MEIEIETWPEPVGRPDAWPCAAEGGRWRLIHVVLSEHDADLERVEHVTKEGQRDA